MGLLHEGVTPAAFNGLTGIGDLPAQLAVFAGFLGTARTVDITVLIAVEGGVGEDIEVCIVCFDGIEHFSPLFVFEYLFVASTSLTFVIIRNIVSLVKGFSASFENSEKFAGIDPALSSKKLDFELEETEEASSARFMRSNGSISR